MRNKEEPIAARRGEEQSGAITGKRSGAKGKERSSETWSVEEREATAKEGRGGEERRRRRREEATAKQGGDGEERRRQPREVETTTRGGEDRTAT